MMGRKRKCENCGRSLSAADAVCPSCDRELAARSPILEFGPASPGAEDPGALQARHRTARLIGTLDLAAAWLLALAFSAAFCWHSLSIQDFPFPGLRTLAEPGISGPYQVLAVIGAAVWLTVKRWHSRERLLMFQGMAVALGVTGVLLLNFAFGMAFLFFANAARSALRLASFPGPTG